MKGTWRGRQAGVTEKNGSAVQSLKVRCMISLMQKVGGSLGEEQFAKQCGDNRSLLLVGGRHKQITIITQVGDDYLTKTWIHLPRMYVLPLLSTCNWTWKKHFVYGACFPKSQFRKRVWTTLKHFKIWSTIPAFPSEDVSKRIPQLFCTVPGCKVSFLWVMQKSIPSAQATQPWCRHHLKLFEW